MSAFYVQNLKLIGFLASAAPHRHTSPARLMHHISTFNSQINYAGTVAALVQQRSVALHILASQRTRLVLHPAAFVPFISCQTSITVSLKKYFL